MDGGTNHVNNPATFVETDLDITLGEPTKDLYTFTAWHDAVTLDSVVTTIDTFADTELWAEFTIIT